MLNRIHGIYTIKYFNATTKSLHFVRIAKNDASLNAKFRSLRKYLVNRHSIKRIRLNYLREAISEQHVFDCLPGFSDFSSKSKIPLEIAMARRSEVEQAI